MTDAQAVEAIEQLQADVKRLAREVSDLRMKAAMGGGGSAEAADTVEVAGVQLIRRKVADLDKDALRGVVDSLKAKIKSGIVVLAAVNNGKVQIVVAVTPDLTGRIKAGQIVKELAPIVGGAGGGRPEFAEAGGKDPTNVDEMLKASEPRSRKSFSEREPGMGFEVPRTTGAFLPAADTPTSCSLTQIVV